MSLSKKKRVYPVILSGGTGSRLWPLSREAHPKQFWNLVGDKTLLQETALRCDGQKIGTNLLDFAPLLVVCNQEHRFKVAEQLREIGLLEGVKIILEPFGRNSAAAIAAASLSALKDDPDALLWVMPADAAIMEPNFIGRALEKAVCAAEADYISIFGIEPIRAETAYGYIEKAEQLFDLETLEKQELYKDIYKVRSFKEKPHLKDAEYMKQDGRYLWNSGMFIFKARIMIEEMEKYQPNLLSFVKTSLALSKRDLDFLRLEEESFKQVPHISIDYAIAEKTDKMAVIPASFAWSDIGSWDALWEISFKDDAQNHVSGNVFLQETTGSYVRSEGPLIALHSVKDLVVIAMKDAVLVIDRQKAQNVKEIVEILKERKNFAAVEHPLTYRPWGNYESLIQGERFQVKRIMVRVGEKLSLQKHFHRSEHWVIVQGTALVRRGEEEIILRENESIYLPQGCVHRLENPGKIDLILIEVQSGSYLGEDDIIRLEDAYLRS